MTEKQIYFGDWKSFDSMVRDFEGIYGDPEDFGDERPQNYRNEEMWRENKAKWEAARAQPRWQNMDVLFAAYTYESYEGDALVIFQRAGKLYEVNGGHCSCYGLSERSYSGETPDQWEPEETTATAILHRLDEGSDYGVIGQFREEIRAAVAGLPQEVTA